MRDPSPYAGKTVRIRADAVDIGGLSADVADWYENTGRRIPWKAALAQNDPRAISYNVHRGMAGLPDDNDVLFATVDGMGRIIHASEIDGYTPTPPTPVAGPSDVSASEIGVPCPACLVPLLAGDKVAAVALGPGINPAARAHARNGQPYEAVMVELHWACRTGDESYQQHGKAPA